MRSDRRFGVEIECGYNGNGIRHECNCSDCGYDEYYDYYDRGCLTAAQLLTQNGFKHWTDQIHEDGSGVEIPSPILQGQKGINELGRVFGLLKNNGFYVGDEDGLHVHHEAPEFKEDKALLRRLIEAWARHQDFIDEFVAEFRSGDYWACERNWTPTTIEQFDNPPQWAQEGMRWGPAGKPYIPGGRGALNIHALWEHGTIEFRQHEGTLDIEQASAWIRFGQAFLDTILKNEKPLTCGSSAQLLKKIRCSENTTKALLSKRDRPQLAAA